MISQALTARTQAIQQSQLNAILKKSSAVAISSLSRTPQIDEASNIKWSAEDQYLIDWVLNNFYNTTSPYFNKNMWDFLQRKIAAGSNSPEAISGVLQSGLKFLQRTILENPKDNTPMSAKVTLRTLENDGEIQ